MQAVLAKQIIDDFYKSSQNHKIISGHHDRDFSIVESGN